MYNIFNILNIHYPVLAPVLEPEPDSVMYNIFNILNFCNNVVTTHELRVQLENTGSHTDMQTHSGNHEP